MGTFKYVCTELNSIITKKSKPLTPHFLKAEDNILTVAAL